MLKQKISDAVSLATIGLATVAAATASLAATVDSNQAVVTYLEQTAMTMPTQHVSRRTLIMHTEATTAAQAASMAKMQVMCTTPAPTTCPKEFAICVSSTRSKGGVGQWECKRPAKKYGR